MKHPLLICAGLLLIHSSADAAEPEAATRREAVVAYFEGPAEGFVEKAIWSSDRIFNVGTHYMGNREDGMASDVCKVLVEHALAAGTRVRVIDINTMGSDPARWKVVGEAFCG